MKLSTQSGQVESVVVFVAKIVTTTLPSKGSYIFARASLLRRRIASADALLSRATPESHESHRWELLGPSIEVELLAFRDDPTQQFRWTGRRRAGGRAMRWRQNSRRDSDYCLDAHKFSNGKPVQAWECNEDDLEHQIWATL